ncbi:MAG: DUF5110 domain-containing protein [Armatimonadetes bacterium]|nr:DUF5110 domain-containing protein [Armatimonadota bacterium]
MKIPDAHQAPGAQVLSVRRIPTGALIQERTGMLKIEPTSTRSFRVRFSLDGHFAAPRVPTLLPVNEVPPFKVTSDGTEVSVRTSAITAVVKRSTGSVSFTTPGGRLIASEAPGTRALRPIDLPGTYRSHLQFKLAPEEAIYGLGQHQDDFLDHRGSVVDLVQQNREVAIPFAVSTGGYGILWNNPAATQVSVDAQDRKPEGLEDENGTPGGLTARYYEGRNFEKLVATRKDPAIDFDWSSTPPPGLPHDDYSVRWTGFIRPEKSGTYSFRSVSDDGVRLWIDGRQVIDDWNDHAAQPDVARVSLSAGRPHAIKLEYFQWNGGAQISLAEVFPTGTMDFQSEASEGLDYTFVYGPSLDGVIGEYRHLTGEAPLPPKWALGFWQSKEHYASQQEWLDVAQEYRARKHPMDVLVQDFLYWDPTWPWGSHQFNPAAYRDPGAALAELHREHVHMLISVWGLFQPGRPGYPDRNREALEAQQDLLPADLRGDDLRFYDAFKPAARALYWAQIRDELFRKGFDGWWLDASEPEVDMWKFRQAPTAAGPGALVLNAYPLMHTIGVSQGQLATDPNRRPVILTRSAYAGQQRTGAITWSGDITGSWQVFQKQIPAGLNFCLSGVPYWTTDIGGFFAPDYIYPKGASDPAYRELFTRWFEYGAFCPIFRVHGTNIAKEMWRFGPETEGVLDRYDRLRYRLMPYIYSQSWQVTHRGGTLMRALAMDFPRDAAARERKDEFLFGPSLLICPVVRPGATTRDVYLPAGTAWFDFWTGKRVAGGRTIQAEAPIGRMPIFVRAGAIVPMGPDIQYVDEKPADPIDLRVYGGADGRFDLYEDAGEGNAYRTGQYSTIPFTLQGHTLRIGTRAGAFLKILVTRTFRVWTPGGTRPIAVHYNGQAQEVSVTPWN